MGTTEKAKAQLALTTCSAIANYLVSQGCRSTMGKTIVEDAATRITGLHALEEGEQMLEVKGLIVPEIHVAAIRTNH